MIAPTNTPPQSLETQQTQTPTLSNQPSTAPIADKPVSFDAPQNWGASTTPTSLVATSIPTENTLTSTPPSHPTHASLFKTVLLALALILLGVLFGVLAAKFFQPNNTTPDVVEEIVNNEASSEADLTTQNLTSEIVEDSTVEWKNYTDNRYKFSFLYPPALTLTTTDNKMINGSLNITVVNRSLESEVKRHEFELVNLVDVVTTDVDKSFKKGAQSSNENFLIGFYPLSTNKTIVITEYTSKSIEEESVNKEFEKILSTFTELEATPSAKKSSTDSATFKTPAS